MKVSYTVSLSIRKEPAMPVYSFECLKCGHKFDETLSVTEYEQKGKKGFSCPKCRSRNVEQLVLGCTVQTSKKS
jgi:putative FmdB family regulatory protein